MLYTNNIYYYAKYIRCLGFPLEILDNESRKRFEQQSCSTRFTPHCYSDNFYLRICLAIR